MGLEDLRKMVETAEEAEKLLKRKADVEAEIAKATKSLEKLNKQLAEREKAIAQADSQYRDISDRFEHERKRFSLDLESHRLQCEGEKKATTLSLQDDVRQLKADRAQHGELHRRSMQQAEQEASEASKVLDAIKVEIADFQRRVAALG